MLNLKSGIAETMLYVAYLTSPILNYIHPNYVISNPI